MPEVLADNTLKINKWKVKEGYQVSAGQVILLYVDVTGDGKDIKRLKAQEVGIVRKRLFKEGEVVQKGQTLLELAECSHTTVIKDMCADCGADLRQNENGTSSDASVPMVHSVPELKVSQKLAQKLGQADTDRLLADRKLVLLVDLDQTLIHTTNDNVPNNLKDVYHFQLYGPNSPWYHTRLRPGTAKFLTNMAPYFELHICTFGARNYANMIALFLDENGKFFSHRILSRDECINFTSKTDNLKSLFPNGDSMVCIIDDREDVWNMASNLIQVKPYHFFQHTGDINALPGMSKHELDGKGVDFSDIKDSSSLAESKEITTKDESKSGEGEKDSSADDGKAKEEQEDSEATIKANEDATEKNSISDSDDQLIEVEDPDDYLLYLEQILVKIHNRFYDIYTNSKEIPDLKVLIPKIRSEVLVGTSLVFSGLVPNHVKLEQSKAYQIARAVGATVAQDLSDATTHLVAAAAGTFKVNAARKRNHVKIVTPDWLWCCAERWERADEMLFPLDAAKPPSKMRQPPAHCHSPEHAVNYHSHQKHEAGESSKKFVDTINPLLSFSNADLAEMNKDFDQFFESSSSSSSSASSNSVHDDDEDSVDIENPPMEKSLRKRKRKEDRRAKREKGKQPPLQLSAEIGNTDDSVDNRLKDTSSSEEEEMISAKFRRGEDLPSDLDLGSNSEGDDSDGGNHKLEDDGDWNMMGAELEREFLGS